tara:strand:- start:421 stop:777 length:357 start_codon:yes stop_codon:yes gene_type:complete
MFNFLTNKYAIIGGRDFNNYQSIKNVMAFQEAVNLIISGGARGADSLAERFAKENGIPFKLFPANWDRYGKSAGYKRNVQIIHACDVVVAFWDGHSKGTKHSIDIAKSLNKPLQVYNY